MAINIVAMIIGAAIVGVVAASAFLHFIKRTKVALRTIDLVSFTIAGLGLVASVIAVGNYEKRAENLKHKVEELKQSFALVKEIQTLVDRSCFYNAELVLKYQKGQRNAIECMRLHDYVAHIRGVDTVRLVKFPPAPNINEFTEPSLSKTLLQIDSRVFDYNEKIEKYQLDELAGTFGQREFFELELIVISANMLAVAFGMGLFRRAVDLYMETK